MIVWQSKLKGTLYRITWKDGWFIPAYCYDTEKGTWTEHIDNRLSLERALYWIGVDLGQDILIV